jgi:dTDP-4-dehydrorhamnose reductase
MRLLVFGESGQVARELARFVPDARLLGRNEADLADPASCAAQVRACRPDAVIIAAAFTAVDRAEAEEDAAQVVNADAPGAIARACAGLGAALVHLSSDYVFDGSGARPWRVDAPPAPLNAYGRSKLAGERAVRAAGGAHVILRTSWVFSAHGTNFVKTMLRLGAARDRLAVVADQTGGPTPASGVAAACLTLARALREGAAGGTYHYAGAPETSWACFARETFRQAKMAVTVEDIPTAAYPTPARRPLNSRLDCTGLADFGLARPDWRAALADVLRELQGGTT